MLGGFFVGRIESTDTRPPAEPIVNDDSPKPPSILYVVRCTFDRGSEEVAQRWLAWLRDSHLAEVLAAGAQSAEVFRIQDSFEQYEIHYRFASRPEFDRYEQFEAPRLRADGLKRFPLELGLHYDRYIAVRQFDGTTGEPP